MFFNLIYSEIYFFFFLFSVVGLTSSRASCTMQILQQQRNIALSFDIQAAQSHIRRTNISKLTTRHFIALQREEIQVHLPEYRRKIP